MYFLLIPSDSVDTERRSTSRYPSPAKKNADCPLPSDRCLRPGEPCPQNKVGSRRSWYEVAKVPLDWTLALVLLVFTAPLLLLAALAVKLSSRGPVIYRQTRLGRRGRPFSMYKIRTMNHNCESESGVCWSQKGDPRVTRVGRFLRATHFDELPQLWNVLRGEMSLIGPRPERPEFVPGLEQAIPCYRVRLAVRPGITGLAQVLLAADSNLDSVRRKLALDLHYIENLSFWLDCRILAGTVLHVMGISYAICRLLFLLPDAAPVPASESEAVAEMLVGVSRNVKLAEPRPGMESA